MTLECKFEYDGVEYFPLNNVVGELLTYEKCLKWIEALKSGEYKKGIGRLIRYIARDKLLNSYCCLGVFANLEDKVEDSKFMGCSLTSLKVFNPSRHGYDNYYLNSYVQKLLARVNDKSTTFYPVIDIIENYIAPAIKEYENSKEG